mgnify:CR=1|jgi:hypothetical protein
MDQEIYDTVIAFITFASIRYALPNYILGKEVSLYAGFVLSVCYALCSFVRAFAKRFNS